MKIRRLAASISACFDDLVSKVENHDAVAQVAIADVQKAAAKIRAEKNKVDQSIRRLQDQLKSQQSDIQLWQARAKSCADTDEGKALQCLKQVKKIKAQVEQGESQQQELLNVATSLNSSLQQVENKLTQLNSKRAILASRESRALAINQSQHAQRELGAMNVDQVFDRWELNILQSEYQDGQHAFADAQQSEDASLAKDFAEAEEREALLAELHALKQDERADVEISVEKSINGVTNTSGVDNKKASQIEGEG
ncbi:hypothetical protein TDB9533_02098 [Thalassocella blandensis]|nr:hypothetical protein TDB9533_02098 [Thalassocella blandensis]